MKNKFKSIFILLCVTFLTLQCDKEQEESIDLGEELIITNSIALDIQQKESNLVVPYTNLILDNEESVSYRDSTSQNNSLLTFREEYGDIDYENLHVLDSANTTTIFPLLNEDSIVTGWLVGSYTDTGAITYRVNKQETTIHIEEGDVLTYRQDDPQYYYYNVESQETASRNLVSRGPILVCGDTYKVVCVGTTGGEGGTYQEECRLSYFGQRCWYENSNEFIDAGDDSSGGGGPWPDPFEDTTGGGGGTNTNTCGEGYIKNDEDVCVLVEEDKIKNELDNPCANDVFTELEDGIYVDDILSPEMQVPISNLDDVLSLNFSESILNLFNGSNTFDFIIQNGTPLNSNANASTNTDLISINPNRWSVTTTINNTYLTNATRLSIARTIIHELVHGYLLARSNELDFTIAIAMYATENGIDISDTNAFHHEFMRQYINGMAYSLYEWDKDYGTGGNLGWDYYYAMAFSGQFQVDTSGTIASTTDTFLELVPNTTDRQNIVNIILNEQNNSNNAQGTDCD